MIKYTVQNYSNAVLFRLGAKVPEILLRPQHGVNPCIVRRIVPVIRGGFKNGAQVKGGDGHLLQVSQFGDDAAQRTTEKVPVAYLSVFIGPPLGRFLPIFMNRSVSHKSRGVEDSQAAKTVWKNLVCHAAAEPLGSRTKVVVYRQLPIGGTAVAAVAGTVQIAAGSVVPPEAKVIPYKIRLSRRIKDQGKAEPVALRTVITQLLFLTRIRKLQMQHQGAVRKALTRQRANAKQNALTAGHRPKGRLTKFTPGVKDKGFAHKQGTVLSKDTGVKRRRNKNGRRDEACCA
ncbi:hypothetical protein SDC9_61284 [bioreactor metagenome]|uniref:Uncharacterized protein n=1 Tax=bioreactor metagenome TaxID=1076179 RepID=A0A644XFA5_9ZZZZ